MRSNNKGSPFPPSPAPAPTPSPSILFRSGALPCRSGNSSTPARQGLSDELGPFQGVGSRPGLGSRELGARPPTALQPDVLARVRSCLGNSRLHATLVGVVLLAWSFWPANRHEPLYGIILCRGGRSRGGNDVAEGGKGNGWSEVRARWVWCAQSPECTRKSYIRFD